jgi:hypothetical protein
MTVPRIIIGDFLCEDTFARDSGLNPRVLTKKVVQSVSAQATLLRAFAGEGDLLWTPLPIDPARLAEVPGLARPELVSGPQEELPAADRVLAWGETRAVRDLRRRLGATADDQFPAAEPAAAAKVNHRSFLLDAGSPALWRLPGAKMLTCIPELEQYLATMDTPPGQWVLKSPWSAAGRLRHVGSGARVEPDARRHVIDLFYRFDELLFEPWVERVADYGVSGVVTDVGVAELARHRQSVDGYGRFRSIRVLPDRSGFPPGLLDAANRAGDLLREAAYRGPYGTDAFEYRGPDDTALLRPVSEINARLTFGHIAHELRERLFPGSDLTLLLGVPPDEARYVPLLHPAEDDSTQAGLLITDQA